jgi:hypothetical protein
MRRRSLVIGLALLAAGCGHAPPPASAPAAAPLDPAAAQRDATRVVYFRATALLYKRDLAGAARLFEARIAQVRARHDPVAEAWLHNVLTWVRWAEDDHAGALAENEQVARAVAEPSVAADDQHGAMLHYWWDRAYLLAEEPSTRPQADEARRAYEAIADPTGDHDGLAVLAAFFAVVDRDGARALAAAGQVDADTDDDLQDLYVLALAHDAGGDHAGAEALRARIARGNEYPMKPIILQRIARDRGTR